MGVGVGSVVRQKPGFWIYSAFLTALEDEPERKAVAVWKQDGRKAGRVSEMGCFGDVLGGKEADKRLTTRFGTWEEISASGFGADCDNIVIRKLV